MKVFRTVQKKYEFLGICPSNESTQENAFNKRIIGFFLFGTNFALHVLYIIHEAHGYMDYMECINSTFTSIITSVCFGAIAFRKTELFECITNIEKFIDARCKYPKSEAFLWKINQQVEQLCKIVFMVVVKIPLQCLMLPRSIISFVTYFTTNSGNDSFKLPIPLWFPFDWNNPMGYLMAVIVEYIIYGYVYFMIACTLALGIGAFWFAAAASKEIQRMIHAINEHAHENKNQSDGLVILFSEYIYAHGTVKQVEHDFSDIYQPIFMSVFTWSLFTISGAMLIFQMEITNHLSIQVILLPIINGILGIILVFIVCELGQRMSGAFEEIELTIDQLDWHLFPIKVQRMLPIIFLIANQPVTLECLKSIRCTRIVFKSVINRAYSYFTVLSQLGN